MKGKDNSYSIEKLARYFDNDSVVLFPTDTVFGIGCRFDSTDGIARIRKIKGIENKSPLAVLVADQNQVDFLKIRRSRVSNVLMERFWPGALTIVQTSENLYPCSGEGNSLGLRMPDAELLRKIIEHVGVPLAATSANFHGQIAPAKLENVDNKLVKMVDHIIDFGIKAMGHASTIVKIEGGLLKILRHGDISEQEINEAVRSSAKG